MERAELLGEMLKGLVFPPCFPLDSGFHLEQRKRLVPVHGQALGSPPYLPILMYDILPFFEPTLLLS